MNANTALALNLADVAVLYVARQDKLHSILYRMTMKRFIEVFPGKSGIPHLHAAREYLQSISDEHGLDNTEMQLLYAVIDRVISVILFVDESTTQDFESFLNRTIKG